MSDGNQDLAGYDRSYYERETTESWFPAHGLPRPDQLAAICYVFGLPFTGKEKNAFSGRRSPGRIMSIGAGDGWLEKTLENLGCEVTGVDPSAGARDLYAGSHLQADCTGIEQYRTVVFCESLEHVPIGQIRDIWQRIRNGSVPDTRIIAVNWPSYFPLGIIMKDWDHITRLDEQLYDELCAGFDVIVRWGSHFVLDVPR